LDAGHVTAYNYAVACVCRQIASAIAIFLMPVMFYVIEHLSSEGRLHRRKKKRTLVGLRYPRVGAVTVASSVFGETPVSILNSGHSLCAKLDADSILLF
jgi:hypothetical protein